MTVFRLDIDLGDSVIIEVTQQTSLERENVASITVETPGIVLISTERYAPDIKVVSSVE